MVLADIARAVEDARIHHIPRDHAEISAQPARYFELKYFFSSHVSHRRRRRSLFHHDSRAGEKLIAAENPAKPRATAVNTLCCQNRYHGGAPLLQYRSLYPFRRQTTQAAGLTQPAGRHYAAQYAGRNVEITEALREFVTTKFMPNSILSGLIGYTWC